jgi:transcriptional repressor NrdR
MDSLRELDPIAYVRFASVYRQFKDIDELRTEIDRVRLASPAPEPERADASGPTEGTNGALP